MEIKYIVHKPFNYGGKRMMPGDEFIPSGGKWDKYLLDPENRFVLAERASDKPAKKSRGRKEHEANHIPK